MRSIFPVHRYNTHTHTHTQWIKRFGERCLNMDRWLKRKTSSDNPDHDPKKKVSDPEKLTSSQTEDPQKNEVKQSKDKFQTNWLKNYPWLEINDGIMSCSDCKMYSSTQFTSQCYKTSTLIRHANGTGHSAALKRKKEAETSKNAMESMTYFVWSFEKAKNWTDLKPMKYTEIERP